EALPGRIGLVIASRRYGGKYGGFWGQTARNLRRSGFGFVNYLGLNYFWYRPLAALARLWGWRCSSLRHVAHAHGAAFLETREPNASDVVARLSNYAPDLILSLHFDHVIRAALIAVPARGVINVHPSLLPALRGPFPAFWALRSKSVPGVSVHVVDSEELDAGPILLQRDMESVPGESVLALDARVMRAGARLAVEAIAKLEAGSAAPRAQAPGAGNYYSYPGKADVAAFRAEKGRLFAWRDVVRLLRDG
ncbi:MAG: formyltransferase family protein, partial [Alphaproteobacteria bacterium]